MDVNGDEQAPQRIVDGVRALPGVASVDEPVYNDPKTVAIVFVKPDFAPQDEGTEQLVDTLRATSSRRRRKAGTQPCTSPA